MNKIFKQLTHSLLLLSLFMMAGCNWLDIEPRGEIKEPNLFSDEDGFKTALNGVYIQMAQAGMYGANSTMVLPELLAQHWRVEGSNHISSKFDKDISDFKYSESDVESFIDSFWKRNYKCIAHINMILKHLKDTEVKFSHGNKELLKGEALGLRAFLHFDMLRFFGPIPDNNAGSTLSIPYQEEITVVPEQLFRLSFNAVCEKITEDLNQAEELLKNDPIASEVKPKIEDKWQTYRKNRFNYYAVKATKARFYNWIGDKTNALQNAKELIDAKTYDGESAFNLMNEDSFRSSGLTMGIEHIFAVHNPKLNDVVDPLFKNNPVRYTQTPAAIKSAYENDENDIRNIKDRYWESAITAGSDRSTNYFKKYTAGAGSHSVVPLIRIAEMYLIAIENSDLGQANEYFETYKGARNLLDHTLYTPLTSEMDVTNRLEKEYRKEFYGEGQMWFYYKRKNVSPLPWPRQKSIPPKYVIDLPLSQKEFENKGS